MACGEGDLDWAKDSADILFVTVVCTMVSSSFAVW